MAELVRQLHRDKDSSIGLQLAYNWLTVGLQLAYNWLAIGLQLAYNWLTIGLQLACTLLARTASTPCATDHKSAACHARQITSQLL